MADKQADAEIIKMVNRQEQNLTLGEACEEYRALKSRLADGTLWARHIIALGEARLNFLKGLITELVCEVKNE
jgi:hypothetical protein